MTSEHDPLRIVPAGVARRLIAAERPGVAEWMDAQQGTGHDPVSQERAVYDAVRHVWVTESRIAENRARFRAEEWLAGRDAMEVL